MKLFVWDGFPIAYYHLVAFAVAESLEQAIEMVKAKGLEEETSLIDEETGDFETGQPFGDIEEWFRENVTIAEIDQAQAWWSEHWS